MRRAGVAVDFAPEVGARRFSLLVQWAVLSLRLGYGSDAEPFMEAGIPAIVLSDLSFSKPFSEHHGPGDRVELLDGHRLAAWSELLAAAVLRLDRLTGRPHWEDEYLVPAQTDVLVNAPSSEVDDPDSPLSLDLGETTEGVCLVDTRVDPPDTWLIQEAQQRGAAFVDGLEIYIQQAVINLKLWTDVDAEPTVIREAVEEFLEL